MCMLTGMGMEFWGQVQKGDMVEQRRWDRRKGIGGVNSSHSQSNCRANISCAWLKQSWF